MIHGLKPYPEYKDSGVPWLGSVPAHWEVLPLKRLAWFKSGAGFPVEEQGRQDLEIPFFKVSDMNRSGNERVMARWSNTVSGEGAIRLGAHVFPRGAIVFPKVGGALLTNKRRIVDQPCCIDNNLMGCVVERGEPGFLLLLLQLIDLGAIAKPGPVPAISEREVREIDAIFPCVSEQTAIVRFLDHADRRIRRYIAAKRRLIALLNEQKQAIIHRAVTRGLDPGVRLKPSGVEWLGEVPEHWEVKRLRDLTVRVTSGSRGWSNLAADSGPLFIRIANLTRGSIGLNLRNTMRLSLPATVLGEAQRTRVNAGDILLSITAFIGSVAVIPEGFEEAYVSQHIACCRLVPGRANPKWVAYVLLSPIGQAHGVLSMYGGTKQGLSLNDVKSYVVVMPPAAEQDQLVQQIEEATASTNGAIQAAQREIDLLHEYRTRLIADVVTGKLDVREAAARLPEEVEAVEPLYEEVMEEEDGSGEGGELVDDGAE